MRLRRLSAASLNNAVSLGGCAGFISARPSNTPGVYELAIAWCSAQTGEERLAKAERDHRDVPRVVGNNRKCGLRRIHPDPLAPGIGWRERVLVIDVDLIAAPAQIRATHMDNTTVNNVLHGSTMWPRADGYLRSFSGYRAFPSCYSGFPLDCFNGAADANDGATRSRENSSQDAHAAHPWC